MKRCFLHSLKLFLLSAMMVIAVTASAQHANQSRAEWQSAGGNYDVVSYGSWDNQTSLITVDFRGQTSSGSHCKYAADPNDPSNMNSSKGTIPCGRHKFKMEAGVLKVWQPGIDGIGKWIPLKLKRRWVNGQEQELP